MRAATLTALASVLAGHFTNAGLWQSIGQTLSLDAYIVREALFSYHGILDNLGNRGAKAPGTASGLLVASPNTANPDYFYSWTRDSALTFKCLIDLFIEADAFLGLDYAPLQQNIQDFISAQAVLQNVSNPSGTLANGGAGLGEPKFEVDLNPFTLPWGRPQRDGPALRSTALITYCNWLISKGQESVARDVIWPIIANDLAYVGQYWNQTGFDLWEETDGSSFFTLVVQHRALVQGDRLAKALGTSCPSCSSQAPQILCFLQSFWNGKYIVANINVNDGRSGIDANSVLGSIHTFDPEAACDDSTFQPCSAKMLANHKVYVDAFRSIYGINKGIPEGKAVNTGRYPDDVYMGGNPWYLCTLAAAEQLYDALYQWNRLGSLEVTETSLAFFQDFSPSVKTGIYTKDSWTYWSLTSAIRNYADGFVGLVKTYTPTNQSLAEEYNRNTGVPASANDLSWSYASFLTAVQRRQSIVPASWGEPSANIVPSTCSASSVTGTYVAAEPPFPTPTQGCVPATVVVPVTFYLIENTYYGENVYMTGNVSALGNWDTSAGFPLSAALYTESVNLWFGTVELIPAGTPFQYKFYKIEPDGYVTWEGGNNREYTIPSSCPIIQPHLNLVWQT